MEERSQTERWKVGPIQRFTSLLKTLMKKPNDGSFVLVVLMLRSIYIQTSFSNFVFLIVLYLFRSTFFIYILFASVMLLDFTESILKSIRKPMISYCVFMDQYCPLMDTISQSNHDGRWYLARNLCVNIYQHISVRNCKSSWNILSQSIYLEDWQRGW